MVVSPMVYIGALAIELGLKREPHSSAGSPYWPGDIGRLASNTAELRPW